MLCLVSITELVFFLVVCFAWWNWQSPCHATGGFDLLRLSSIMLRRCWLLGLASLIIDWGYRAREARRWSKCFHVQREARVRCSRAIFYSVFDVLHNSFSPVLSFTRSCHSRIPPRLMTVVDLEGKKSEQRNFGCANIPFSKFRDFNFIIVDRAQENWRSGLARDINTSICTAYPAYLMLSSSMKTVKRQNVLCYPGARHIVIKMQVVPARLRPRIPSKQCEDSLNVTSNACCNCDPDLCQQASWADFRLNILTTRRKHHQLRNASQATSKKLRSVQVMFFV